MKLYLLGAKVVVAMDRMAGWDGCNGGEALFRVVKLPIENS